MTTKHVDMERIRLVMKEQGVLARREWDQQVETRNEILVSIGGQICTEVTRTGDVCTFPATALTFDGPRCHHHGGPSLPPGESPPTHLVLADAGLHRGGPCDCDWTDPRNGTVARLRHRVLPTPDQRRYGHSKDSPRVKPR